MSYYRTGDYYLAGDPGLFSSIGGFVKRAATGFLAGGPLGAGIAVASPVLRQIGGGSRNIAMPGPTDPLTSQIQRMPGLPMIAPPSGPVAGPGMQKPAGYHLNKSGYFLKDGTYVAPGTKWVKNRTRNFANGKALNRAISRTAGFNRLVKRSRKNLRALSKI